MCYFFSRLYTLHVESVAAADVEIETNKGCVDDTQFALSEDIMISYRLAGAAPSSEYIYWVKICTDAGGMLCTDRV